MVTERIEDIKPLGFYIRRLCDGKETYRMQPRSELPGQDPGALSPPLILQKEMYKLHNRSLIYDTFFDL